jgi:hypothetical protein
MVAFVWRQLFGPMPVVGFDGQLIPIEHRGMRTLIVLSDSAQDAWDNHGATE